MLPLPPRDRDFEHMGEAVYLTCRTASRARSSTANSSSTVSAWNAMRYELINSVCKQKPLVNKP